MEILNPEKCAAGLLALVLVCAGAALGRDGLPHWLTVITADQLQGDIQFLASEELAGRDVLSPGSRTAAAFIASRFAALGLKPAGEGDRDWYQRVPLLQARVRSGACRVEPAGKQPALELNWGVDFDVANRKELFEGFAVSGEAVFAGYGIHAPKLGHDDFAGLDVRDRVVIVFAGEPEKYADREERNGLDLNYFSSVGQKASNAMSRGAGAIIVLPLPGTAGEELQLRGDFWPDALVLEEEVEIRKIFPALFLEARAAARFAARTGIESMKPGDDPRRLPGVRISCDMELESPRAVNTRNVLALIPGSDELRFREFIIVSAHYDHLGKRGGGLSFPGADDNASGVAAMLGAARALAALPLHRRPARSILFVAWAGEERGALGSRTFLRHPTVPWGQIKAMINLDMVGRDKDGEKANSNTARATYSAQVPGLEALLDESAAAAGLDLRLDPLLEFSRKFDHGGFHTAEVPSVHFFTGLHQDYHGFGDTPDKINTPKLLKVSQAAALLAFQLADEDEPPVFDRSMDKVQTRSDPF